MSAEAVTAQEAAKLMVGTKDRSLCCNCVLMSADSAGMGRFQQPASTRSFV